MYIRISKNKLFDIITGNSGRRVGEIPIDFVIELFGSSLITEIDIISYSNELSARNYCENSVVEAQEDLREFNNRLIKEIK